MTSQVIPADCVDAVKSRHMPFVWDFGFGPATSCREAEYLPLIQARIDRQETAA